MRPDGASLVLGPFAGTKGPRLPGRNPATPNITMSQELETNVRVIHLPAFLQATSKRYLPYTSSNCKARNINSEWSAFSKCSNQEISHSTARCRILSGNEPGVLKNKRSPRLIGLLINRPAFNQFGLRQERHDLFEFRKLFFFIRKAGDLFVFKTFTTKTLLISAACHGLKSAPARRPRGAYPHHE
jgi:hypothetical protein